jgi:hypothetical protein
MKNRLLAFYVAIIPSLVMAQASLPPETGSFLDKIALFLHNIPAGVMVSVVAALEFLLRFFPTAAPASLLVPLKKGLDMLVYILSYVSDFMGSLVVVANKVK